MPGSVTSYSASHSSAASRKGQRAYKTVNRNSHVDETLFGKPASQQNAAEARNTSAPVTQTVSRMSGKSKPETIDIITKDLIRSLIIPREDPSGESIVIPYKEFSRLQAQSKRMGAQEKEALMRRIREEKDTEQDAAAERKKLLAREDLKRKKNEKLNELEEEARQQKEHLLAQAQQQREEETDEIKRLNELILNCKCHAIRDAQMLEKDVVKTELQEEERRLDAMMELERQRQNKLQEEYEEIKKLKKMESADIIKSQIKAREEHRILAEELREQEARVIRAQQEKMEEEDLQQLLKKKLAQKDMAKALNEANDETKHLRTRAKEQERALDLKVMRYLQEKAEREEAREKEIIEQKKEKELEIARLRALQERAQDRQAEQDALKAKRNTEAAEREWRRKELEEAVKKQETNEMLMKAREEQLKYKEMAHAIEISKAQMEFSRVLAAQEEDMAKEKEKDQKKSERKKVFAQDIRSQIREKEQVRIQHRNKFFEEGVKMAEEAKERRDRIEAIKSKKLEELKEMGVPQKYLSEVVRRMGNPHPVGVS